VGSNPTDVIAFANFYKVEASFVLGQFHSAFTQAPNKQNASAGHPKQSKSQHALDDAAKPGKPSVVAGLTAQRTEMKGNEGNYLQSPFPY
jgi:hypothetical protein